MIYDDIFNRNAPPVEEISDTGKVEDLGSIDEGVKEAEFISYSEVNEEKNEGAAERVTPETGPRQGEASGGHALIQDAAAGSEMMVSLYDILISQICGAISGNPAEAHTIGRLEKRQLQKSIQLYIETSGPGGNMSPGTVLFMTIIIITGVSIFGAVKERKKNKNEKATRRKYSDAVRSGKVEDAEILEEDKIKSYEVGRGRFKIDENGYYEYDEAGVYVNQEARAQKPSNRILEMIEDGKTGWEIKRFIKKQVGE